MPIIYQKMIYREDLQRNPNVLYLFGDNEARVGHGGQAKEMRGEPNARGIRTKQDPGTYWSDYCYEQNKQMLVEDISPLIPLLRNNKIIIIPSDGLGTGFAEMEIRCPRTFRSLQVWMECLKHWEV